MANLAKFLGKTLANKSRMVELKTIHPSDMERPCHKTKLRKTDSISAICPRFERKELLPELS
jgi:hypothetical protein